MLFLFSQLIPLKLLLKKQMEREFGLVATENQAGLHLGLESGNGQTILILFPTLI